MGRSEGLGLFSPTVLGLFVLLLLAIAFRSALILIIWTLLVGAVLLSYIWGRHALSRIEYKRTLERHRCFPGEEMELRVELTNRKVLPVTYLTVDDTVPLELEILSRKLAFARIGKGVLRLLFGLAWYQKVTRHYRIKAGKRGFYRLGPVHLQGGDPFGFVEQTRTLEAPETLIVYPKVVPLAQLGIPTRRPFGDLKSRDRLFEDPLRFAGTREYQPGDPLNRVHWKASAVSGTLQVKQLDPSANLGLAVFINTWGWDMFWQGTDVEAMETACSLAASVVNWACEENLPVGVYGNALTHDWGFTLRLPPARGPQVLTTCLEGLARLEMPARTSIGELLAAEVPSLSYGTAVVVITRQVTEATAATLLRVHQSGRPVTLILAGAGAEDLPPMPGVRVYHVSGEEALHAAVLA